VLKGQTVRIQAMSLHHVFLDDGARYGIGPVPEEHYGHSPLRPGMALVVAAHSAANGGTLVTLPCQCQLLLLQAPAPTPDSPS
jgi:hypothetical protein